MKNRALVRSLVIGVVALAGLPVSSAMAQREVRVMATMEDGGPFGGGSNRIAKSGVEKYSKMLGLTDDQKAAASALHEGYDAAFTAASTELRTGMEEMRKTAEETDDRSVFMEKMPKLREQYSKKTKELEKNFMNDLQALLTTEQKNNWGKVERQRRREVLLRPGSVSGEGVNLLEIVEGLKLPSDVNAKLADPMNAYETDMDRALVSKQKMLDDQPEFDPGRGFDMEAFQARMQKNREAGTKIKEVNESHERRIEAELPDGKKTEFNDAVKRATYPMVYRPSRVARAMDAAEKFEDLTAGQKESLAALKASYQRDAGSANDKWAGEIAAAEKKGENGGEMAMPGGGRMQVNFGDENEDSPLAQARKSRRELDEKTKGRLDFILTKEQKDRLPKEPEGEQRMRGGPGGAIRIGG